MKCLVTLFLLFPILAYANCNDPVSQATTTQCAVDEYKAIVDELNKAISLMEFCTSTSLKREQEAWYNSIVQSCRKSLKDDQGGSLYHHLYVSCLGKYTTARIDVLEARARQCFK